MGNNLLYNYVQAASFIKESDSTLRWWVQELDSVLDLPESDKGTKRFRKSDIEKLKQIKKLIREDGYSLSQVKELYKEEASNKSMVQQSNTIELDKFVNALLNKFDSRINSLKEDMLEQNKQFIFKLLENQVELNSSISEQIANNNQSIVDSINNMKDDDLNKHFTDIKSEIDEIKESQNEQTEFAKFVLEQLKKQENHNKSWFKKLSLKFRLMNTVKHK